MLKLTITWTYFVVLLLNTDKNTLKRAKLHSGKRKLTNRKENNTASKHSKLSKETSKFLMLMEMNEVALRSTKQRETAQSASRLLLFIARPRVLEALLLMKVQLPSFWLQRLSTKRHVHFLNPSEPKQRE
jgi:hypothetical protein